MKTASDNTALAAAGGSRSRKPNRMRRGRNDTNLIAAKAGPDDECYNCHRKGHWASDCWSKGGGKEGQKPNRNPRGKDRPSANSANNSDMATYAFSATSDYASVANALKVPAALQAAITHHAVSSSKTSRRSPRNPSERLMNAQSMPLAREIWKSSY